MRRSCRLDTTFARQLHFKSWQVQQNDELRQLLTDALLASTHLNLPLSFNVRLSALWSPHDKRIMAQSKATTASPIAGEACIVKAYERAQNNSDTITVDDLLQWERANGPLHDDCVLMLISQSQEQRLRERSMFPFTVQAHNVNSTVVNAPVNITEVDIVEGSGEEPHMKHIPLWFGVHYTVIEWLIRERQVFNIITDAPSIDPPEWASDLESSATDTAAIYGVYVVVNLDNALLFESATSRGAHVIIVPYAIALWRIEALAYAMPPRERLDVMTQPIPSNVYLYGHTSEYADCRYYRNRRHFMPYMPSSRKGAAFSTQYCTHLISALLALLFLTVQ